MIHGEEKICESEQDDGRNSPPLPEVETRNKGYLGLELLPGNIYLIINVGSKYSTGVLMK
jgi:hypothetical protein